LPGLLITKALWILLWLPQILLARFPATQQQAALSGSEGVLVFVVRQEQVHFSVASHFFSTTNLFASQLDLSSNSMQYPWSWHSWQLFLLVE